MVEEETTIVPVKTAKTIITVEPVKAVVAVKMIVAEPVRAIDAAVR
jgi:hypothetical protein